MTHLRKNDAGGTPASELFPLKILTRCYIRAVEDFSRRFHLPPDRLGPRQDLAPIRAELFQVSASCLLAGPWRRAWLLCGFFYTKTLRRAWSDCRNSLPEKGHIASRRSSASKKSRN